VYALHKKLPPDTVEAMRLGYGGALEFLETAILPQRLFGACGRVEKKPRQRVVSLEQLDSALSEGWVFMATLSDRRAVIEGS